MDADSEGEEGKYYVWTADEINTVLGKDAPHFSAYYNNITKGGNWNTKKYLFRNLLM
jgi:uncharacterized protein YyaL (SSP411 family)